MGACCSAAGKNDHDVINKPLTLEGTLYYF